MTQEIKRGDIEINIHHWAIGDVARTRKPNLVAWGEGELSGKAALEQFDN